MNSRRTIRIALICTAATLSPLALLAQNPADPMVPPTSSTGPNPPTRPQPGSTSMQESTGAMGSTAEMMRDKMFLRKAAAGGMAEVQFGQLAAQKAESPDVKAFGEKMAADHTALNEELKPVADSMGIMLPKKISKEDQAEYDKLNALAGADFDTEYLTFMLKDHHKDLREFRDEARNASDPTLKDAVIKGEKVIREHTIMVEKLAKDKGIQSAGHKPPAGTSE
jgi:putative membrane protein